MLLEIDGLLRLLRERCRYYLELARSFNLIVALIANAIARVFHI